MSLKEKDRAPWIASILVALVVGAALGWIWRGWSEPKPVAHFDNNNDGVPDVEILSTNRVVSAMRRDRNFDGQWDYFEWYQDHQTIKSESDNNFDGQIDGWGQWKDGYVRTSSHDLDDNGVADMIVAYQFDIPQYAFCRPNGATNFVHVELYEHGCVRKEYRDADGDGLLESVTLYDAFGNTVLEEKVTPAVLPWKIPETALGWLWGPPL